ncbi:hypothetical protein ANCCAN_02889 [Ancylostoma caninum]|uniref:G-protein coupled receptors family 1 profile domain-containing protein n=1 Tax=Ancylostoma caninum TaxID=29170 RepID=A0A368H3C2_ANCCA|nr:hypothetical protein ANCCAN_02889 [Ancylostoma caninum]
MIIILVTSSESWDCFRLHAVMSNFSCLGDPVTVACLNLGEAILTIASMLTVMLIIILGNLLVVVTVYRDRKLRLQRQNWLIISLALADLLVGLLVMPLTLIYEIIGEWKMGNVLCEMWLALDVLFVTASILHICAISLDRYFSVTSPLTYPAKRTPKRMFIYIGVSWVVSLLICLPPIFGWRPERRPGECAVSTDIGYVLYSSLGSFYIPVIILVIVYAKIYSITIKHSRQRLKETERRDNTLSLLTAKPTTKQIVELELLEENSDGDEKDNSTNKEAINQVCWHLRKISEELPTVKLKKVSATQRILHTFDPKRVVLPKSEKELNAEKRRRKLKAKERQATLLLGIILSAFILSWLPFFEAINQVCWHLRKISEELPTVKLKKVSATQRILHTFDPKRVVLPKSEKELNAEKRRRKLKAKERQATLLLGIILSAFILSWLPFFVMYVIGAFGYEAPAVVFKFFFWLGYCNSGINPVIYTVFNREFKRGLCRQLRKFERYVEPITDFYK